MLSAARVSLHVDKEQDQLAARHENNACDNEANANDKTHWESHAVDGRTSRVIQCGYRALGRYPDHGERGGNRPNRLTALKERGSGGRCSAFLAVHPPLRRSYSNASLR